MKGAGRMMVWNGRGGYSLLFDCIENFLAIPHRAHLNEHEGDLKKGKDLCNI
jgi:hypothetical protein